MSLLSSRLFTIQLAASLAFVGLGCSDPEAHSEPGRLTLAGNVNDCLQTRTQALIDDFEDGDLAFSPESKLDGSWSVSGDAEATPSPWIGVEADLDDPENLALHAIGRASTEAPFGATVSARFYPTPPCAVRATNFAGVALRLKLVGDARLELRIPQTDDPFICNQDCGDHYGLEVVGDGTWHEVVLPFNALLQENSTSCFNHSASLVGIGVAFPQAEVPFDLWLDDVRLVFADELPECPMLPASETRLIDDFEDGDLSSPLGGTWRGSRGALESVETADGTALFAGCEPSSVPGPGFEYCLNRVQLAFASTQPGCGADASDFDGVEIRGLLPADRATVAYQFAEQSGEAQQCVGAVVQFPTTGEWGTYRVRFSDVFADVDRERLLSLSLEADGEIWLDSVTLFKNGSGADLGSPCSEDTDCSTLKCWRGDGGPAGGFCTIGCFDDWICADWNGEEPVTGVGNCISPMDGPGFCTTPCTPNDVFEPGLRPEKCHGRSDLACVVARCHPRCMHDEQCGEDLYCGADGLCTSVEPSGEPLGSACDPDAEVPVCAGTCSTTTFSCTTLCILGCVGDDCPSCPGEAEQCLPLLGQAASGDLGECAKPCDCNAECEQGSSCLPVALRVPTGSLGVCSAAESPSADLPDCPSACPQGSVRACRGPGECLGVAKCESDASGYGPCQCPETLGAGGDGGSGGEEPANAGAPGAAGGESVGGRGSAGTRDPGGGSEIEAGASGGSAPAGGAPDAAEPPIRTLEANCGCSQPGRDPKGSLAMMSLLLLATLRRRKRGQVSDQRPSA